MKRVMTVLSADVPEFQAFIRIIGRGKKRRRTLTQDEAKQAMQMILQGQVTDMQLGAFLMLIRVREETVEEAAGFAEAIRETYCAPVCEVDLDWGSYAGKRRQLPWFLLALQLLVERGYRVCLHGLVGQDDNRLYTQAVAKQLGWSIADSLADAKRLIEQQGCCYVPVEAFAPQVKALIDLKSEIGLRSPVNTVARMLNPFSAKVSVHGAFHKGYDLLHQETAMRIEEDTMTLGFCGDSGEAEVRPDKPTDIKVAQNHQAWSFEMPKTFQNTDPTKKSLRVEELIAVWDGKQRHEFGEATLVHTFAMALVALEGLTVKEALETAREVWGLHQAERLHKVESG